MAWWSSELTNEQKSLFNPSGRSGSCDVYRMMLFEKFDELKQILGCQNLTDAELLISIGKATKDNKFVESLQLEEKIVREIFVEVLDKLSWLGESYVELI